MFTENEKSIMLELLSKVTISPTQNNAVEVIQTIQSLIVKLSEPKKEE